jgi:hypothetical protein
LAVDSRGNLYVGEMGNNLIRKIVIATQTVTTIAGTGAAAWADGFGTNAAFSSPIGLVVDARGNMLVAESANQRVRVMQPTVPCPAGYYCATGLDRALCAATFYCPEGSATPTPCPVGNFYCPSGSVAPISIACPAGCVESSHFQIP